MLGIKGKSSSKDKKIYVVVEVQCIQGCGTGKFEDGSGSDILSDMVPVPAPAPVPAPVLGHTYIYIYEYVYIYVYIFANVYIYTNLNIYLYTTITYTHVEASGDKRYDSTGLLTDK